MKRILALNGGGIRGVFTLQILARIEELFRQEQNQPDLVLGDVFDLIAGTSTGAIIAAFLSWGLPVRELEKLYIAQSPKMFAKGSWAQQWKSKYKPEAIARFFRERFTEEDGVTPALLGTKRLRKFLLIVMRNGSTGSPWPVCNKARLIYQKLKAFALFSTATATLLSLLALTFSFLNISGLVLTVPKCLSLLLPLASAAIFSF